LQGKASKPVLNATNFYYFVNSVQRERAKRKLTDATEGNGTAVGKCAKGKTAARRELTKTIEGDGTAVSENGSTPERTRKTIERKRRAINEFTETARRDGTAAEGKRPGSE